MNEFWKRTRSSRTMLLAGIVLALALAAGPAGASGESATAVGLQRPGAQCAPDPVEFLTQPTIFGTPTVGSVLTSSSGTVYCADFMQSTFFRSNGQTVRIGPVQSCAQNECTKTDTYTVVLGDVGHSIKAGWRAWNGQTQAYAESPFIGPVPQPPPPPPPSQAVNDIYGDNGEPILQEWSNGSGGNQWRVRKYANRYVIWTSGRGTYVVGRLAARTQIPGNPNNYMGPGYIGQFSPNGAPTNKMVANDALFPDFADIPPGTPRDGVHGGLGCFAVDFFRIGTGLVDLHCRRIWNVNGSTAGVYEVDDANAVSGDAIGVFLTITTRYRDSVGYVFDVTYEHRFEAEGVTTTYAWTSRTNNVAYIKEPRIVAVLGTSEVPIYLGQGKYQSRSCEAPIDDGTYGHGAGVWGLEPSLIRIQDTDHHWNMNDAAPWCQTVTIGPGATGVGRRYHRGGFSFNVVGVPRNLSVEDYGYNHDYDGTGSGDSDPNFNKWRQNSDPAPGIPAGDYCNVGGDVPQGMCLSIKAKQPICDVCAANAWEIARVPNEPFEPFKFAPFGQHGVFVAVEAWRASISLWNFMERSRRLPATGTAYVETLKF